MKSLLLTICFASISGSALWAQEAHKVDDREAKKLISEFSKAIKANKKSLSGRLVAVQNLGQRSHRLLIKPLLKTARSDSAKSVKQAATLALGNQPPKYARSALTMLLKKTSVTANPNITAAIVKAFNQGSYQTRDYKTFKSLFERGIADQRCVAAQIAIIELFGQQREVQAALYLAGHIDEPAPVSVDDPSNPPASYWKARYKNWQKWGSRLKHSLFQITGQRFASSKEADTWIRKNRNKIKAKRVKSSTKR